MSTAIPRPIFTLHVGQAGIQIGHAVWELFCLEHNIDVDGVPKRYCGDLGNVDSVFFATPNGGYYPRSIFVDTDPFCIDEVRSGPYRSLFNSRQLVSDHIDSGLNYATGHYGYVKSLLPDTIDRLRWLMEKTDAKPTVALFHSVCGGTGSGFAVSLLTTAADELGLLSRNTLDFCVIPGQTAAQNSCELLNSALYLDESQTLARQTFCISNSALFRICSTQLMSNGRATYAHLNRIVAAAFSNLTATERLPGSSVNLQSLLDSLLPFEHLKYPTLACASFLTAELAKNDQITAKGVTSTVLESGSQFLDLDPRSGRHAAAFLLYRGQISISEAHKLAAEFTAKGHIQFHDWAPAGFCSGVISLPPLAPPNSGFASPLVSVTMLTNHSAISGIFSRLSALAKRLHDADLFIHSYEGALISLLSRDTGSSTAAIGTESIGSVNNSLENQITRTSKNLSYWMSGGMPNQPQSQQQQQQLPPSRTSEKQRTGLSDVFGVRLRLSSAISYLNQISRVYASKYRAHTVSSKTSEPPELVSDDDVTVIMDAGSVENMEFMPSPVMPKEGEPSVVGIGRLYEQLPTDEEPPSSNQLEPKSKSPPQKQPLEQQQQSQYEPDTFTSTGSNSTGCQPSWWSSLQLGASLHKAVSQFSLMVRRRTTRIKRAPRAATAAAASTTAESDSSWTPQFEASNQPDLDSPSSIAIAEAQRIL